MLKNLFWVLLENIGVVLLSFISSVYVARSFSKENYGEYAFSVSLLAVFQVLSHFGLPSVAVRKLTLSNDLRSSLINTAALKFLGCLIGFFLFNVYSFFFIDEYEIRIMCFILSLSILFRVVEVVQYLFESLNKNKDNAQVKLLSSITGSLSRILLVFSNVSYFLVTLSHLFASFVTFFMFLYKKKIWRDFKNKMKLPQLTEVHSLFKDCYMIFLGTVFAVIYLKIDQVMIKNMISSKSLATYVVSSNLTEYLYFFPNALLIVLMPKLVRAYNDDKNIYFNYMKGISSFLFFAALLIAILVSFSSQYIINFIYGDKYLQSAQILNIHIWAAVLIFLRVPFSRHIVISKAPKFSFITQGSGCIVNIILNYFLIPEMGGKGAAIATFLSYFISGFLILFLFKETRSFFYIMLNSLNPKNLFIVKKIL